MFARDTKLKRQWLGSPVRSGNIVDYAAAGHSEGISLGSVDCLRLPDVAIYA
jgi:hypothetical protein